MVLAVPRERIGKFRCESDATAITVIDDGMGICHWNAGSEKASILGKAVSHQPGYQPYLPGKVYLWATEDTAVFMDGWSV